MYRKRNQHEINNSAFRCIFTSTGNSTIIRLCSFITTSSPASSSSSSSILHFVVMISAAYQEKKSASDKFECVLLYFHLYREPKMFGHFIFTLTLFFLHFFFMDKFADHTTCKLALKLISGISHRCTCASHYSFLQLWKWSRPSSFRCRFFFPFLQRFYTPIATAPFVPPPPPPQSPSVNHHDYHLKTRLPSLSPCN